MQKMHVGKLQQCTENGIHRVIFKYDHLLFDAETMHF